jgi:Tol biopolymer transport system component
MLFVVTSSEERPMKHYTAIAVLAIVTAAITLGVAAASATAPGKNGRIAYKLFLDNAQTRAAILTIRPNGTEKRWVTHPAPGILHLIPDWSADGRWIVFTRSGEDWDVTQLRAHRPRIFRIHPNGTGRMDLSASCVDPCRFDDDPAWSPSGKRVAFTRAFGENLEEVDLMVMHADGSHARHITRHHASTRNQDWAAQWAPNGKRLVFHRVDTKRELSAIFTIRPDGSGLRRLTPWRIDAHGQPDWSPNGRWINYESFRGPCLVHPSGADRHCLVSGGGQFEWGSGSFSPDGTKIVVPRAPGVGPPSHYDVFRIDTDGSHLVNITQTARWDGNPDWGPRP